MMINSLLRFNVRVFWRHSGHVMQGSSNLLGRSNHFLLSRNCSIISPPLNILGISSLNRSLATDSSAGVSNPQEKPSRIRSSLLNMVKKSKVGGTKRTNPTTPNKSDSLKETSFSSSTTTTTPSSSIQTPYPKLSSNKKSNKNEESNSRVETGAQSVGRKNLDRTSTKAETSAKIDSKSSSKEAAEPKRVIDRRTIAEIGMRIRKLGKQERWSEAFAEFDQMKTNRKRPTSFIFDNLIHVCSLHKPEKMWNKAVGYYNDMKKYQCVPEQYTFANLLSCAAPHKQNSYSIQFRTEVVKRLHWAQKAKTLPTLPTPLLSPSLRTRSSNPATSTGKTWSQEELEHNASLFRQQQQQMEGEILRDNLFPPNASKPSNPASTSTSTDSPLSLADLVQQMREEKKRVRTRVEWLAQEMERWEVYPNVEGYNALLSALNAIDDPRAMTAVARELRLPPDLLRCLPEFPELDLEQQILAQYQQNQQKQQQQQQQLPTNSTEGEDDVRYSLGSGRDGSKSAPAVQYGDNDGVGDRSTNSTSSSSPNEGEERERGVGDSPLLRQVQMDILTPLDLQAHHLRRERGYVLASNPKHSNLSSSDTSSSSSSSSPSSSSSGRLSGLLAMASRKHRQLISLAHSNPEAVLHPLPDIRTFTLLVEGIGRHDLPSVLSLWARLRLHQQKFEAMAQERDELAAEEEREREEEERQRQEQQSLYESRGGKGGRRKREAQSFLEQQKAKQEAELEQDEKEFEKEYAEYQAMMQKEKGSQPLQHKQKHQKNRLEQQQQQQRSTPYDPEKVTQLETMKQQQQQLKQQLQENEEVLEGTPLGVQLDSQFYLVLLQGCLFHRDSQAALKVWEGLDRDGVPLNRPLLTTLAKLLTLLHLPESAPSLLRKAQKLPKGEFDIVLLRSILHLGTSSLWSKAPESSSSSSSTSTSPAALNTAEFVREVLRVIYDRDHGQFLLPSAPLWRKDPAVLVLLLDFALKSREAEEALSRLEQLQSVCPTDWREHLKRTRAEKRLERLCSGDFVQRQKLAQLLAKPSRSPKEKVNQAATATEEEQQLTEEEVREEGGMWEDRRNKADQRRSRGRRPVEDTEEDEESKFKSSYRDVNNILVADEDLDADIWDKDNEDSREFIVVGFDKSNKSKKDAKKNAFLSSDFTEFMDQKKGRSVSPRKNVKQR